MDDLAPSLPCLKDQLDCPLAVKHNNVLMTPFAICNLLIRNVTPKMEDEYNCLYDTVPTDPNRLVEKLTKIETKLQIISNEQHKSNDHHKGGPPNDAQRRSWWGKSRPNAKGGGAPNKTATSLVNLLQRRRPMNTVNSARSREDRPKSIPHFSMQEVGGGRQIPRWMEGQKNR